MRRSPATVPGETRWLKRLRRELAGSGRRSQLAWQLSLQDGRPHTEWSRHLHSITLGESRPDPDLILFLESLLARPQQNPAPLADQSLFLFAGDSP